MEIILNLLFLSLKVADYILTLYFNYKAKGKKQILPPIKSDLVRISATELAKIIRRQQISSEEVCKAYIKRIKQVNPILNAIVEERFPKAVREAKNVDEYLRKTSLSEAELEKIKPLLGVPITIKESCSVKDVMQILQAVLQVVGAKEDAVKVILDSSRPFTVTGKMQFCISPTKALQNQVLLKAKQRQYRKKLYDARKKVKKLEKEVQSMKTVVKYLEDKNNISNNGLAHVNQTIDSVPNLLMSRYLKNIKNNTVTHESYPAPLRRFAATLQFYSCRAYEEVRSAFALALPSQATIRKWYTNIDCNPGYIDTTFEILEKKCQSSNYEVICSLMIDEMSIKKQIETDGQKTWGYVDIGVPIDNDQLLPATQVLAVMVVAQNSQWKLPIAYFLIHSLTGADKANIITESLIRLHKVGVKITSVTCDGPNGNFTMFKLLGCNFEDPRNMKAYFLHPETSEKIFCIFDPCHMLKLVRNNFCELKELMDPSKKQVKWELLEKLHKIQKEETLNVANKLKNAHIQWKNQKMKVALAAQTLSRSVADALKFLRLDLEHPDFLESEATENFIYLIDQLFDCLNSRSPFAKGLKGPIRENNENIWRPFLIQAKDYLLGCTEVHTGRPLYMTGKKTPFIGFAITIDAIFGIFQDYVVSKRLNYLLTFKMSQDHLETFFCALRCRNGWNNNPTALQFMYSFRRLLLHTRVAGRGGNCRVLDSTVVLSLPSTSGKSEAPVDLSLMRRYNLEANTAVLEDHDYDCTTTFLPLSVYSTNVVAYMGGYVVKMLEKRRLCTNCLTEGALADSSEATGQSYMLIARKNRGMSFCTGTISRVGYKADTDGEAVARVISCGAIVLLVSNTPELCMGWETRNLVTGQTSNPYDSTCSAAGSSGGEGALLGAGASLVGIGSDVAGSIRLPSAFNGIFGHKPTPRIIPIKGHFPTSSSERFPEHFVIGPLSRYAKDLRLLTKAMAGNRMSTELKLDEPVALSQLNVFWMEEFGYRLSAHSVDTDVKDAVRKAAKHLTKICGAMAQDFKFDEFKYGLDFCGTYLGSIPDFPNPLKWHREMLFYIGARWDTLRVMYARIYLILPHRPPSRLIHENTNLFVELVKSLFGKSNFSFHFLHMQFIMFISTHVASDHTVDVSRIKKLVVDTLGTNGILIIPTWIGSAFKHKQFFFKNGFAYMTLANALGLPSTNVPCGFDRNGMPIGIQVMAAPHQDRLCFAVAEELEQLFGGWVPPPEE